ncbi:LysR family transcriptional regulator [Alicyclobacillus fastidiosus]|uniref:LysR family transcriptional regulator n=1 Tax=Alicyclobacillus fastidiosus TaxID=392011 RepID=A0ABV5ANT6_9BACL|nr:LysR family transcriptional regulator [Alicyclobacillus fastidiosus]WEH09080.1 LysR family transcriptional regulator [Alicyclobacillus fastidiosus]
MDLKKLLYFVAIVEDGQITSAARRLHMAQPALSLQLKALEEEIGVTLIERNNKIIELTQPGRTLYCRAKEILNSVEGAITEVQEQGKGIRGKLSIGTVMSCVSYLPKAITTSQELYPNITFQIWEGESNQVEDLLQSRVIELGITGLPLESNNLEMVPLSTEPLVAVQPPNWSVFNSPCICVKELQDYPLMMVHGQGGKGGYERFLETCQKFDFNPRIICESPDVATLLTLVDSGVGVAVVARSAIALRPKGTMSYVEISPLISSDTAIVWIKNRRLSKAAEHFKEILKISVQ